MRLIGELRHESQARVFRAYLISRGINNDVEMGRNGLWGVWVHDEEKLDAARAELESFLSDPKSDRFRTGAREGEEKERVERKEARRNRTEIVDMRTRWGTPRISGIGIVTITLIVISVVVTILMNVRDDKLMQHWLSISDFVVSAGMVGWKTNLSEVMHGQVWRLVTPIFLHFGFFHIFFNMTMLYQLGGLMESRDGSWLMIAQVLVYAVAGNLLQFYWTGPLFGGMSGVIYGIFGYIWIMGKYGGVMEYMMDSTTVAIMIGWFFLCLFGVLGNVANGAHLGGLVLGIVWASIRLRRIPFLRR